MPKLVALLVMLSGCAAIAQQKEQATIDSAIAKLSQMKEDTNKVNLLNSIAIQYINLNADAGFKYSNAALELGTRLGWKKGILTAKIASGRLYWRKGNTAEAVAEHTAAMELAEALGYKQQAAQLEVFIGQDYADGGDYPKALEHFNKALAVYKKTNDQPGIYSVYQLFSWVYEKQGRFPEAAKASMDALKIAETTGDEYSIAIAASNVASDYLQIGREKDAIPYYERSTPIYIKEGDYINVSSNYLSLAAAYTSLHQYREALKNATDALETGKKINNADCIGDAYSAIADILLDQDNFAEAAENLKSSIKSYHAVDAGYSLADSYSKLSMCYVRLKQAAAAKSALDSALFYGKGLDSRLLFAQYLNGKQLYDSLTGNWKSAYLNHHKYITIRDSLENAENTTKMLQSHVQYEFDKKEAAAKAEQEKKDTRQRAIRNSIAAGLAGALLFLVVVYRQRNKISKARKRSDELLLNILPAEVADELKAKGSADAKQFDEVTVMFTDFKGFTQISEKLSPAELVSEINTCFRAFDNIVSKHNIEKIKTIGDAYMCAGGLPVVNTTHAEDVVKAALEIRQFMQEYLQKRQEENKEVFEIRIGIHTGTVVAGIVGIKKFAYDIWGDTVNLASRMESCGEAGKVNISRDTYDLVKDKFNCVHRGKIYAKNKGEVDMYFVEG